MSGSCVCIFYGEEVNGVGGGSFEGSGGDDGA